MRLVVARKSLQGILRWTQGILFVCALALLGYCGFVLLDARNFEKAERLRLDSLLRDQAAHLTAPAVAPPPVNGDLIGSIDISRIGLSAIVVEGTDRTTLRRAVGHIEGTAVPGQSGNVGLAGHRDTFFRSLRNVQENDIVTLTTVAGKYRYRVVSTRVVGPNEVSVLDPSGTEILTLVTCYPFYFVGPAPDRFIVKAARIT
jgi:sortase A